MGFKSYFECRGGQSGFKFIWEGIVQFQKMGYFKKISNQGSDNLKYHDFVIYFLHSPKRNILVKKKIPSEQFTFLHIIWKFRTFQKKRIKEDQRQKRK